MYKMLPYASVADWLRLLNFALAASLDIWMSRSSILTNLVCLSNNVMVNTNMSRYYNIIKKLI